ncbi:hypothetical protein IFM89_011471 [Coptis chinensis]|uniref:Glucan endo-1,3-beta-D-glucosidase n=1 Tax=Coptis chinensis TaxID=261450 RepID=A0A835IZN0_9MAGN|nr:hypothetical protein IFM89_011471 [Coptis chinensis]
MALDKCQLGDDVRKKEWKLDSLGRVLLQRTKFLVLDEATSSVNTATKVDPILEQKWETLEDERARDDAINTIRSSMPAAMVLGDYVIERNHHYFDSDDEEDDEYDESYEDGLVCRRMSLDTTDFEEGEDESSLGRRRGKVVDSGRQVRSHLIPKHSTCSDGDGIFPIKYALFQPLSSIKQIIVHPNTVFCYSNMFDAMVDAAYYSMVALNFSGIPVVTESGWPWLGGTEPAATIENAEAYNNNLIHRVLNNSGPPSQPSVPVSTYIYELIKNNFWELIKGCVLHCERRCRSKFLGNWFGLGLWAWES